MWLKLLFSTWASTVLAPPVPLAPRALSALTFTTLKGCPERQYALLPTVHPAPTAAHESIAEVIGLHVDEIHQKIVTDVVVGV